MHKTQADVARLMDAIGEVNDDGMTGSGLTGRIMRTEAKVLAYDRWRDRAASFAAGLAVTAGIVWWLIKDRLASFFGVSVS